MRNITRPKLKLKEKQEEHTVYTIGLPLYFSGTCLTDNKNFTDFVSNLLFEKEREPVQYKPFVFQQKTLIYELGEEVFPKEKDNFFIFPNDFVVDKLYVNHFNKHTFKYYYLESFLGGHTNKKVGLIESNKLIGVLMLHKRKGN